MLINSRMSRRVLLFLGTAALVCGLNRPSLAEDRFGGSTPSDPPQAWYQTPARGMGDVAVAPDGKVWLAGKNGTIWFSSGQETAEGMTFSQVAGSGFRRIAATSNQVVWAVGSNGTLWKLADGNWTQTPASGIEDVAVGPDGKIWLTGICSRLTRTCENSIWSSSDQGATFTQVTGSGFRRIAVAPNNIVWAVGDNGTLWKLANGNWTQTSASGIGDVTVDPDNVIWLAGSNGTIWSSSDQGATFTQVTGSGFESVAAGFRSRGLTLWAVGANGTLWEHYIREFPPH